MSDSSIPVVGGDPEPSLGPHDHEHARNVVTRTWGAKIDNSAGLFQKFPSPPHVGLGPSANRHSDPLKGA